MSSPVTMPPNWDPNRPWENVPQVRPAPTPPPQESFLDMLRRWVGAAQLPQPVPSPTPLAITEGAPDPLEMARRRAAAQSNPAIRALGEGASNVPLTTGTQADALRR